MSPFDVLFHTDSVITWSVKSVLKQKEKAREKDKVLK